MSIGFSSCRQRTGLSMVKPDFGGHSRSSGGDPVAPAWYSVTNPFPQRKYKIQTDELLVFSLQTGSVPLGVVPPCYSLYIQCSSDMLKISQYYPPIIVSFSPDEAFMDFTSKGDTAFPALT